MKYIVCRVYRRRKLFLDVPFIFPEIVVHSHMFDAARMALHEQYPKDRGYTIRALSAGSFSSMDARVVCGGESTTLGIKSRGKKDAQLILMADYGSCMMPG